MKFAIVDDDKIFRIEMQKRITAICKTCNYTPDFYHFSHADNLLNNTEFAKFDAIFLDIGMPGINGLEVAYEINKTRHGNTLPYIIFVTSKDYLVFEALKQFPYSFIRKDCIEDLNSCIKVLSEKLISSPTYSIKTGRGIVVVEICDILYLEKTGNYTVFHTVGGIHQERSNIDSKYKDLSQYSFLRPHIGALVNAAHIKEYEKDYIKMSNDSIISISRSYKQSFKIELQKWMARVK